MLSVYALCLCAQLSLGAGALLCLLFRCWLCSVRAEGILLPTGLAAGVQTPGKSHMSHTIPCEATQKHRKILQVPQIPQSCNVMHLQTTSRAADWDRKHTKTHRTSFNPNLQSSTTYLLLSRRGRQNGCLSCKRGTRLLRQDGETTQLAISSKPLT